ncbi:HEPN domain-containing protein [Colwellia sp. BRX10-4]|jgi:hypothetical protein|uniref:HEPN domain-containing protein n=1 Tax=Colwellia sp. BRX10-4 TaxID=2759843 RepID=UPI0015F6D5AD|nr:HEPN domain-containing protein [Colwellia sp. BRX10-4]MBA6398243.1 hypothetical protein [Colwellia sp. BRX10-4]
MAYSKSRSRCSFENLLGNLLLLSRKASYKSSGFSYAHQNLIYQAAIFSICAGIEEYSKNFFEDYIFECAKAEVTFDKMPLNLRLMSLLRGQKDLFKQHLFNGDEAKTLKKMASSRSIYNVLQDDTIIDRSIVAGTILGTNKYPSIKNLKIVYNRIGISDIFLELHRKSQNDITSQLSSFLDIREAISHQTPSSLTYTDITRHLSNLKNIINYLDRIKYSHLVKVSGADCWPS